MSVTEITKLMFCSDSLLIAQPTRGIGEVRPMQAQQKRHYGEKPNTVCTNHDS